jgi:hypothetical protein
VPTETRTANINYLNGHCPMSVQFKIIGDLKLFELKTMRSLVTVRDHEDHQPSPIAGSPDRGQ